MQQSLSEQICEVCGIKPYYGLLINFGDLDNNYKLVTNKRKCRLIADYRYMVDNEDELRNLKPEYLPDFENNSNNFVKLFNLNYTQSNENTIASYILFRYKTLINTKSFLSCLLFELQHIRGKEAEQIKQIIRNEQWEI